MLRSFTRRAAFILILAPVLSGLTTLHAQDRTPQVLVARQGGQVVVVPSGLDQRRAEDLRNEFRQLMEQYPPALSRVLKLDASLMTNADYLAPYPALLSYLQAHPEVPRYPDYFLSFASDGGWNGWQEPMDAAAQLRRDAINAQRNMFEGLTIVGAISAVVIGVTWLVRLFVSHRRWIRATRMQSELNNRLLERLGSNDQLLAYLQSQTGQQLMAAPVITDMSAPTAAAPLSRILWAVQAGLVLVSAGIGLLIVRNYVFEEAGDQLLTMGVLGISIGVGFAAASVASYLLSQRFGLLDSSRGTNDSGRA